MKFQRTAKQCLVLKSNPTMIACLVRLKYLLYFFFIFVILPELSSACIKIPDSICDCDDHLSYSDSSSYPTGSWRCDFIAKDFSSDGGYGDILYKIQYRKDDSVIFECDTTDPPYDVVVPQMNFTKIHALKFVKCSLSNMVISDVFGMNESHPIEEIRIERSNASISSGMFKTIAGRLKRLVLKKSKIENISQGFFNDFTNLKHLELSESSLVSLPVDVFANLSSLVILELYEDELATLEEFMFQNLTKLEKLYLHKNKLKELPERIFDSLVNLKMLDLTENFLGQLPEKLLQSLSSLTHLRLRKNPLSTLPKELFRNSSSLSVLDLSSNKFEGALPEELLSGALSLENLTIIDTNLKTFHPNFFSQNFNLTNLNFQKNTITSLPENLFLNNTLLREVNFKSNYISEIPQKLFPNQEHLEKLSFSRNSLTDIPDGLFKHSRRIKTLSVDNNRLQKLSIEVFRDLKELLNLELQCNNLIQIKLGLHSDLRTIDLSNNSFSKIPITNFDTYLKLEKVSLKYNNIQSVEVPTLPTTAINPVIDLSNNNISTVDVNLIIVNDYAVQNDIPEEDQRSYTVTKVLLKNNPFMCDCKLYNFYNYIKPSKTKFKKYTNFESANSLTCNSPKVLSGKSIVSISPSQYTCEITQDCPNPCHCYISAGDNAITVNCSDKGFKALPDTTPVNTKKLLFNKNMLQNITELNEHRWQNLTDISLDDNLISSLDNWTLSSKMENVSLRGNRIKRLSSSLMSFSPQTKNFQISLGHNPFTCDCSTLDMKTWLSTNFRLISDVENVTCDSIFKNNNSEVHASIISTPGDELCPINDWPYKRNLIVTISICVILALLLLIVSILYYRHKQTVIAYVYIHMGVVFNCFFSEEDIDEEKIFDAFVSYSSSDRDVAMKLIDELEEKDPRFILCIHDRNWIAGNQISWNIFNSVHNSKRTILIVSKEFLKSMWFQVEFRTAYSQMLEDKIDRVIIIVKGELPPKDSMDKDLQFLMSTKTYLVWEEKWFWEKLRYALPHKKHLLSSDVAALKDKPDSEKIKAVENDIALYSITHNEVNEKDKNSHGRICEKEMNSHVNAAMILAE